MKKFILGLMIGIACTVSLPTLAAGTRTVAQKIQRIHHRLQGHDADIEELQNQITTSESEADARLDRLCDLLGYTEETCQPQ